MDKSSAGRFLEDFVPGERIRHATPHTVSSGDQAVYGAIYGTRFTVNQSELFARAAGYPSIPLDDLLVFHLVFGSTVADISTNAVANLGYADCRFLQPVFVGDTLAATSEVLGIKVNTNGETGTVHVRTMGTNQKGQPVLQYVRWLMVKRRSNGSLNEHTVSQQPDAVDANLLGESCPPIDTAAWDNELSGSAYRFQDYVAGERIDHWDGVTIEDSEHMMATRFYRNTARVHFNALANATSRFGRRLVYGGHVMSIARALSYNGLANAFHIAAINSGRHTAPVFAGTTLYAWTEIKDVVELAARSDVGALRILTRAIKDISSSGFPERVAGPDEPGVVLELDYWVLMPR